MRGTQTAVQRILTALVLGGSALALLLVLPPTTAPADEADEGPPTPDYAFYKRHIAPWLTETCAPCHANARMRREVGRHWLQPAPGRTVRERHHERNYQTILSLLEPGNGAASLVLLKPLSAQDGGLTHKGGDLLDPNTPQYGFLVDWINGQTLPDTAWRPPPTEPGQPDFKYYLAHVAPVIGDVCAQCHHGEGQGRFAVLAGNPREPLTLEQHYTNFQTALTLIRPGVPARSRFLQKPLDEGEPTGISHKGGDLLRPGDGIYEHFVGLIVGEPGPDLPTNREGETLTLAAPGLDVEAEAMLATGVPMERSTSATSGTAMQAASGTLVLHTDLQVSDAGTWQVEVRTKPGWAPLRLRIGQGPPIELSLPEDDVAPDGLVRVGPRTLCDGLEPLEDVAGHVAIQDGHIHMDARGAHARWLAPDPEIPHRGAEIVVRLPDDEEVGDAFLLFDATDGENARLVGLVDGGRRVVLGVLEGGQVRILHAAPAQPDEDRKTRVLGVQIHAGVLVGKLDGRAHVFADFDEPLRHDRLGRFGALTYGQVVVEHAALRDQYEVHTVKPRIQPILRLGRGRLRVALEVPADGTWVDSLHIRVPSE